MTPSDICASIEPSPNSVYAICWITPALRIGSGRGSIGIGLVDAHEAG